MQSQAEDNARDGRQIDLSRLLADPDPSRLKPRRSVQARNDPLPQKTLDDWLFAAAAEALRTGAPVALAHSICNTDRMVGARLAGEIARRYGDGGLPGRDG